MGSGSGGGGVRQSLCSLHSFRSLRRRGPLFCASGGRYNSLFIYLRCSWSGVGVGGGVAAWPAGRPFSEGGLQGGEGGTCENARDEGLDAGLRLVISI